MAASYSLAVEAGLSTTGPGAADAVGGVCTILRSIASTEKLVISKLRSFILDPFLIGLERWECVIFVAW
ncbi:hypothetical protein GCM10027022_09510 [Alpinimonas psychrophila]